MRFRIAASYPILLLGALAAVLSSCAGAPNRSYVPAAQSAGRTAVSPSDVRQEAAKPGDTGTARFTVVVPPPASPREHYVSPATRSIRIQLQTVNGGGPQKPVSKVVRLAKSNSKDCHPKGRGLSCTFDIVFPVGNDGFAVALYGTTKGKGTALSSVSLTATIARNRVKRIPLVPNGTVAKIVPSTTTLGAFVDGTTQTLKFGVTALDPSGATIVGPADYAQEIAVGLVHSGDFGGLYIKTTGIASPSQNVVTLTYESSRPMQYGEIALSSPNAPTVNVYLYPLTVTPATGLLGFLTGAFPPQPQYLSVSEARDTAPYVISSPAVTGGSATALAFSCAPADCAPSSEGATVQMTFTAQSVGAGVYTLMDALGTRVALPYRVSLWQNFSTIAQPGRLNNVVSGPDGNIWSIVSSGTNGSFSQMTPAGAVTTYALPSPFNPANSPAAAAGPDSAIWFADGSTPYIYRISTAAATVGQVTSFATVNGADPTSVALGVDNRTMYFADSLGSVGSIDTMTNIVSVKTNPYSLNSPATSLVFDKSGIAYMLANGDVWKMAPSGIITELGYPKLPNGQYVPPDELVLGPDGDIWTASYYGYLCKQNLAGDTVNCYPTALNASISAFAVGPDGALYITGTTDSNRSAIVRATTAGVTTTYLTPDCCPVQNNLTIGSDGALWIAVTTGLDRMLP